MMKNILFSVLFLISFKTLSAKEVLIYKCKYDKDISVELSLLDKSAPTMGFFYKDSKFALCHLENTPMTRMSNPRAHISSSFWVLKLKTCDYYIEKYKDKISVSSEINFKEGGAQAGNTLALATNHQSIKCVAKK